MVENRAMLKPSNDRKVSTLIRITSKGEQKPRHSNAFGLPAGITCPGKTPFCESCYAGQTEAMWGGVRRAMQHNYDTLLACHDSVVGMTTALDYVVAVAYDQGSRVYRIHWDGDFFSYNYALAWGNVIAAYPDVQFYAYTRSFEFVPALQGHSNLECYLSVDEYNLDAARECLATYPWLHVAACADTQDDAAVLIDSLGRGRAPACPENVKRLPLVVAMDGRRSTPLVEGVDAQGACAACMMCPAGRADVRFAIKKR
jgi:protein gp88